MPNNANITIIIYPCVEKPKQVKDKSTKQQQAK